MRFIAHFVALFVASIAQASCAAISEPSKQLISLINAPNPDPHSLHLLIHTYSEDPEFNINCHNPDGHLMTPMMYTVELPSQDCLRVLLAADHINVNAKDKLRYTALHFACLPNGQPGAVKLLIEAGAKLNEAEKEQGCTPLIFAAGNDHLESVHLLVNAQGIDVHKKGTNGNNALLACISANTGPNSLKISELLVKEAKIDPFVTNNQEKEAFQLAVLNKRVDILQMLLDHVNPNKDKIIPRLGEAYRVAVLQGDREAALLVHQYMKFTLTLVDPEARRAEAALFPNGFQ